MPAEGRSARGDRGRSGVWLLKCNPAVWDLRRFRASGEDRLTSWSAGERGFWRAADGHHGIRARVEVDIALLDEGVTDAELKTAGVASPGGAAVRVVMQ